MQLLPYLVAFWLFAVGMYGLSTTRNFIHATGSLAVVQASTYVMLLAIGFRRGGRAPVLYGVSRGAPIVDPIVQALALTDIVVGAAAAALILSFAVNAARRAGTLDPRELRAMRG